MLPPRNEGSFWPSRNSIAAFGDAARNGTGKSSVMNMCSHSAWPRATRRLGTQSFCNASNTWAPFRTQLSIDLMELFFAACPLCANSGHPRRRDRKTASRRSLRNRISLSDARLSVLSSDNGNARLVLFPLDTVVLYPPLHRINREFRI